MKIFEHEGVRFHHNAGLEGEVIVQVVASTVSKVPLPQPGEPPLTTVAVSGKALKALVLEALREEAISRLEQATYTELAARLAGPVPVVRHSYPHELA